MTYVTDLKLAISNRPARLGRALAAIGRRLLRAIVASQEARARRVIEQYRRDGLIGPGREGVPPARPRARVRVVQPSTVSRPSSLKARARQGARTASA